MAEEFDKTRFDQQLRTALKRVQFILEHHKQPLSPDKVTHVYNDKYRLAEQILHLSIAAVVNTLEYLGMNRQCLKNIVQAAQDQTITLAFRAREECKFNRQVEKVIKSQRRSIIAFITQHIENTITEYFWDFSFEYEIYFYVGRDVDNRIVFRQRSGQREIKTLANEHPFPEVSMPDPREIDCTWLFKQILPESMEVDFDIDRNDEKCHTPRRNKEIHEAFRFFQNLAQYASFVTSYFDHHLFDVKNEDDMFEVDFSPINTDGLFVPNIPAFRPSTDEKEIMEEKFGESFVVIRDLSGDSSVIVPKDDVAQFLLEQRNSLAAKQEDLFKIFGKYETRFFVADDAFLPLLGKHILQVCQHFADGLEFIEHMIMEQLVAAIGSQISSRDFNHYMVYHNRNLLLEEFKPQTFCYAVRRQSHYPEGILSLEFNNEAVYTFVRETSAEYPMSFPINAATNVSFFGERYMHSWIRHQFTGEADGELSLNARTRQLSSFILLVGNIASGTLFLPKASIILQNKDDLKIILDMETIPSKRQFKKAVQSMSPEQQRFSKAFREMQLESTLLGILVLQIKPQLERLLNLPYDSLTKEIRLTQDILQLFIEFNIPSDLLSFDGDPELDDNQKIGTVRNQVDALFSLIQRKKDLQNQEQQQAILHNFALGAAFNNYDYAAERSRDSDSESRIAASGGMFSDECSFSDEDEDDEKCGGTESLEADEKKVDKKKGDKEKDISLETMFGDDDAEIIDYTAIPGTIDDKLEKYHLDDAVRPTIIRIGDSWKIRAQNALMSSPKIGSLSEDDKHVEEVKALELIDALSRSGGLPFDNATLHVVMSSSHCFDKTVMDTIVQGNVNPIEKVELSTLVIGSTIHDTSPADLVDHEQLERLNELFPELLNEYQAEV